jgi:hypothetical protein
MKKQNDQKLHCRVFYVLQNCAHKNGLESGIGRAKGVTKLSKNLKGSRRDFADTVNVAASSALSSGERIQPERMSFPCNSSQFVEFSW